MAIMTLGVDFRSGRSSRSWNPAGHAHEALRPPLFVLHPEGADRALRKRHAVRIPEPVAGRPGGVRRLRAALAAETFPVARGWRTPGDGGHQHHRIPRCPPSGTDTTDSRQ